MALGKAKSFAGVVFGVVCNIEFWVSDFKKQSYDLELIEVIWSRREAQTVDA